MTTPSVLWNQANDEHSDDPDARRLRYLELMRQHGLIVDGKSQPLPCGYDGHKED